MKTCIFVLTLALAAPAMAVDSFNGNWGEFEDGLFAALLFNAADVERIVVHPDGEWAVMLPDQVLSSPGFPGTALWVLEFYVDNAPAAELRAFEFTDSVHFVAVDSWGAWRYGAAPGFDALADFVDDSVQGEQVRALALTPAGDGWVVATDRRAAALNAPTALTAALDDCIEVGRQPDHVAFVSGGWAVMCDQWAATGGLAGHGLRSRISSYQRSGFPVRFMVGSGEAYMLGADHSRPADDGSPLWDMEYNFGGQNIWKQMADADVEGVQIAYFDGTETVVRSYGVMHEDLERPVLSGTTFYLASISKYLSSLAALRLHDKKVIHMDALQNQAPLVTPVSLTRLMSHTAGVRPQWFDLGPVGEPTWTTAQLLAGADPGGDPTTQPAAPGAYLYSNHSYLLAQSVLENATNLSMTQILQQEVFAPLGMDTAFVASPFPLGRKQQMATPHDQAGGDPQPMFVPRFIAAAGVVATAPDVLSAALAFASPNPFNPYLTAAARARLAVDNRVGSGRYSLGLFGAPSGTWGHTGSFLNGTANEMWIDAGNGRAFVVLTNSRRAGDGGSTSFRRRLRNVFRNALPSPLAP